MAVTRIKNNQITDATVVANAKLVDYSISSAKLANNLTYNSNFTISGNLTVQGNTTQIDTNITTIEDPVIVLASTQTSGAPTVDIGFVGPRGNQSNIAFVWDESATEFVTAFTSTGETNTTISITSYANFHTNDANIGGNIVINGITSLVGNLISANVTGTVNAGNLLTPGIVSATGTGTFGNVNTGGAVSATGNITGGNLLTGGLISATSTITSAANITGSNILTAGLVSAASNIIGANILTGGLISATSTITSAANITGSNLLTGGLISSAGNVTGGNLNTAGQVVATSNITGGNLLTGGIISATSNITGGNILFGSGIVSGTGNITGGNIIANDAFFGNINLTGDITVNSLTSNTFVSATGNVISGNVTTGGVVSATGTITGGNLATGGTVSATGNITGGNINTAGAVSATGTITSAITITGGNLATGGTVSATGNITGGNLLTGGLISAAGLATSGNVQTAGYVSATGNVYGGNIVSNTVTNTSGDLTITAASDLVLAPTGNIVMDGGKYINNVLDPIQAQDAATKQYVDDAVSSGIHIHQPVYLETPTALPSATYAQGGNTFTVNQTIAGNTVVFSTAANLQPNDQLWFSNSFEGIVGNTSYFVVSTPNTSAAVLSTSYNGAPVSNITSNTGLTQSVRVNSGIGATLTGTANGLLTVDSVTVSNSDRILVYQQANAVQNGVYVVTQPGNATSAFILTRSSDTNTYIPDDSNGLDQGSYFYVQAGATGAGESYVKTAPSGPFIFGYNNITFTQFSASQVYTANTAAGLSLTGTVFSAKVDNNTTAFDIGGNISVKAGANLTTPNIGAATGTSLSLTGNVTSGNVLSPGAVSATGNVIGGNVNTGGQISAAGNILTSGAISATGTATLGNVETSGTVSATGTVTGGNLATGGTISSTGTATLGNVQTGGTVSATGTATVGNLATGGTVSATGNVTGGNLLTSGLISATGSVTGGSFTTTGNVTGGNILFGSGIVSGTGNIYANTIFANISGNIDAGGSNTEIQFNDDDVLAGSPGFTFNKVGNVITANGNITGANLFTGGTVSATANITGGNLLTGGLISATGGITSAADVTGANIVTAGQVTATGNVIGGNVSTAGLVTATGNVTGGNLLTAGLVSATGTLTGSNLILTSGSINGPASGRITINGADADVDFAVNGDTTANILYIDAGTGTASFGSSAQVTNAIVAFNATNSILFPVGNTGQRPGTGVTGMVRFNTTNNNLEVYDNSQWTAVGVPSFTVIDDEQFNGDGSTVAFTLATSQTTNSCIVSINGVVQIPTLAYSVSGTTLTFTEAPLSGDVIDVRQITTTTTVTSISNTSGNAEIGVSDTSNVVTVTGRLQGTGNLLTVQGDLSVTGNVNITGNIATNQINNGTSAVQIPVSNGNVNIDVGAVDNMAVFATSGLFITGNISATGDVTAQNVNSLSDATLKTNVEPIENAGAVIDALEGKGYDWKDGSGHAYGMIAQQVEEVLPEAVKTDENGIKSVNYQMVVPFLVETVKQLRQDIAEIKAQLKK